MTDVCNIRSEHILMSMPFEWWNEEDDKLKRAKNTKHFTTNINIQQYYYKIENRKYIFASIFVNEKCNIRCDNNATEHFV